MTTMTVTDYLPPTPNTHIVAPDLERHGDSNQPIVWVVGVTGFISNIKRNLGYFH
jgi:hypothetical protein